MRRARSPQISPDGQSVVFAATQPDLKKNRNQTDLYRVSLDGGEVVRLTRQGSSNTEPAFAPRNRGIAFTSNRVDGVSQIFILPEEGDPRQVTRLSLGARGPVWFPDGKRLLVVSPVYTDTTDQTEIEKREKEKKESGTQYRLINGLMFRHWDTWTEDKVDHLFVVDVETGEARDVTPGPYPVPPRSLGGAPDYAVSPDGSEICFVSLRDDAQALSTNLNLWVIPVEGGEPRRVSPWEGMNVHPVYSPDGGRIAYCGARRAGYEADRLELLILDRASGKVSEVAPGFAESTSAPTWSSDGSALYFGAEDKGRRRVYRVPAGGGEPVALTGEAVDHDPVVSPDGKWVVFLRETLSSPPEIYRVGVDGGEPKALGNMNAEVLGGLDLPGCEDFWFEGAKGAKVHGMIVKPPGFAEGKKYPVVFLIHGGPQGMFGLDFHERWNTQLFASPGFVVAQINPRGSTGFGQEFTDAIRGEWGGACYEDLIRGFDYVLDHYEFCDRERTGAAGASFGGFMVNWIAGLTDRFKCLVSHDGIFNMEMSEFATDELWFSEWEFGGAPWDSPEEYRKWSPHQHAGNMKTPMLVIQGEQDFRCPASEGLTLFTALQRRGVPSQLLYLPDEGHWVLKPKNREMWYGTVLGWLEKYLK